MLVVPVMLVLSGVLFTRWGRVLNSTDSTTQFAIRERDDPDDEMAGDYGELVLPNG
jgi:hypothetical protein